MTALTKSLPYRGRFRGGFGFYSIKLSKILKPDAVSICILLISRLSGNLISVVNFF